MTNDATYQLGNGARVGVIGGGPAGAFFAASLLDMAARAGKQIEVVIYEPRDFSVAGPKGCNGCAGIVSESLVQMLAADGITLPPTVVQRDIDAYVMHMDVGSARIEPAGQEKRIGALFRGAGPRDLRQTTWTGLDAHLLGLAVQRGAQVIGARVQEVEWQEGRPVVIAPAQPPQTYDLLAVSAGVNTAILKHFAEADLGYDLPQTTKTTLREYYLGAATVQAVLGNAIQVFLLDIPRLEFGMLIPKGEYMTVCLLGQEIDNDLVRAFLTAPEVQAVLPPGLALDNPSCQCAPRINTGGPRQPFGDRLVFVGDSASTRLYKDGVGSAYRTARAAASAALFHGVSAQDFRQHYLPACRDIEDDNRLGRLIFAAVSMVQRQKLARHAVLQMILDEQDRPVGMRPMSTVQWNMYTGSGSYREILLHMLRPGFAWGMFKGALAALGLGRRAPSAADPAADGARSQEAPFIPASQADPSALAEIVGQT